MKKLLPRLVLYDALGAVGLLIATLRGWTSKIVYGDSSGISLFVFALFLGTLFWTLKLAGEVDDVGGTLTYKNILLAKLQKIKLDLETAFRINSSLVMLGLIGTVVGGSTALLSIDMDAVADVDQIKDVFKGFLNGMGVALYATLTGSVLNFFFGFHLTMIEKEVSRLEAQD